RSQPAPLALRDPTMATAGRSVGGSVPRYQSSGGGRLVCSSRAGYPTWPRTTFWTPFVGMKGVVGSRASELSAGTIRREADSAAPREGQAARTKGQESRIVAKEGRCTWSTTRLLITSSRLSALRAGRLVPLAHLGQLADPDLLGAASDPGEGSVLP